APGGGAGAARRPGRSGGAAGPPGHHPPTRLVRGRRQRPRARIPRVGQSIGGAPMARFLFSVWPELGHMYPSLPIAFALRAADHQVAYTTLPRFRDLLRSHGIERFPLAHAVPDDVTSPGGEDDIRESTETTFYAFPKAVTVA